MMDSSGHMRVGKDTAMRELRLFLIAVQFFTRIPIPAWVGFEPEWLRQSSRYYPLVGLVVGLVTAGAYMLAAWVLPQGVAVLLSMAVGIWLTGAFHEDGFADVCDGLGGGVTAERALDIMKDSRLGTYGVVGIGLLLALKALALAEMPVGFVVWVLFVAHPLSRLCSAVLIWRMRYAREEGRAKPLAQSMSDREFAFVAVTGLAPWTLAWVLSDAPGRAWWVGLLCAALATVWFARVFHRRLNGFTGDCLGAVQQFSELAFYLGVLACLGAGAWGAI